MKKKYIFKLILLILFLVGVINYFITGPSSVSLFQSISIIALTAIWMYDEITINKNIKRSLYQVVIDRGIILILIFISMFIAYSLITK